MQYVIDSSIGKLLDLYTTGSADPASNPVNPMPNDRQRPTTTDIATLDVDAIVTAANTSLLVGCEPRVRAALECALAAPADGESA